MCPVAIPNSINISFKNHTGFFIIQLQFAQRFQIYNKSLVAYRCLLIYDLDTAVGPQSFFSKNRVKTNLQVKGINKRKTL